ncbi:hypothetical protein BU23DRAFT_599501 [Bimuria novae-zelandiae CBS 107.79]|uniref:Uncharacterized protein n=1 Tax=Bimuria novae-zelandiae CBS 107.79 TaxID=1447943 RepID=A0A6A5V7U6_9PLEO|nr:hypothetical protein BU23DRAFT_599501 [Bimuria novae-zelandiae CBS 107.79]
MVVKNVPSTGAPVKAPNSDHDRPSLTMHGPFVNFPPEFVHRVELLLLFLLGTVLVVRSCVCPMLPVAPRGRSMRADGFFPPVQVAVVRVRAPLPLLFRKPSCVCPILPVAPRRRSKCADIGFSGLLQTPVAGTVSKAWSVIDRRKHYPKREVEQRRLVIDRSCPFLKTLEAFCNPISSAPSVDDHPEDSSRRSGYQGSHYKAH